MKLLVFSDSHGATSRMEDIIKREQPDGIIHCGDHITDCDKLRRKFKNLSFYSVVGNCDYQGDGETELFITLCGRKLYITHGHLYGIKRDYTNLIYAGLERGADVIVCGHTHIPLFEDVEGMKLINPGSVTLSMRTYGIIEMDGESFNYYPQN